MQFISATSTDNYVKYELGQICNLTISNDSATNTIAFSSNGNIVDLAVLYAGETQTFLNITITNLYIKSNTAGQPANFRVNAWA